MVKTLIHLHTSASKDSILDRWSLLFMCRLRKIDCIAITDHDELCHGLAWRGFFAAHGIRVIPGEEIFTTEGEIIGLFLHEKIPGGLTPEETVTCIRAQQGIVYVPHPYEERRHRSVLAPAARERIAGDIELMEVHNGRNYCAAYDARQREICENVHAVPVIGEDAHCFFEVGRNYMILPDFSDATSFRQAVRRPIAVHAASVIHIANRVTQMVHLGKLLWKGNLREIQRILARKLVQRQPAAR